MGMELSGAIDGCYCLACEDNRRKHFNRIYARLAGRAATAKRLDKWARRFAHTLDDVPLVYGDTVYWWEDKRVQSGIWVGIGFDGPTVEQSSGDLCWPPLDRLYSTPEAAKAYAGAGGVNTEKEG